MKIHDILSPRIEEKIAEYTEMKEHLARKVVHFEEERNALFKQYIHPLLDTTKPIVNHRDIDYLMFHIIDRILREKQITLSLEFITDVITYYNRSHDVRLRVGKSDQHKDYQFTITYPTYAKHVAKQTKKNILVYGINQQHAEIGKKFLEAALIYEKSLNEAHNLQKVITQLRKSHKLIMRHID